MKKYKFAAVLLSAVLLLTSCGTSNTVATVGNEKITKSQFEFYLSSVKQQMAGTELTSDEDWQTKEIEGKKAIDLAKEKTLETAVTNLAYIQVGKKMGYTLTQEEEKYIDQYVETIKKNYGGEEKYKQFLKENGLTNEFIAMLCESMEFSDKLTEKIKQESPITSEQTDQYFKQQYRRAKHILIPTMDLNTQTPYSEEKKAEAKANADALYQRALAGENFEALVSEYSQDPGSKSNPDGYIFTDGDMVGEFTNGVDSVQPGQVTMIESMFGYHIIKRYALDETPELYQTFLNSKKTEVEKALLANVLEKQMEVWKTEYSIEVKKNDKVYDSITQ